MPQSKKIGLCLSGGGARGLAHIGVLQALEEHKLIPHQVAGASMGAIVGAFYAEGLKPFDILDILSRPRFYKAFSWGIPREGLTDLSYLKKMLKDNIEEDNFESLKKELFVSVTNLNTGEFEILRSGKLSQAVLASAAIPLLFKPVRIDDQTYVDGGLMNNLPIEPLQKNQLLIGVNVNDYRPMDNLEGMFNIGERCANVMVWQNVRPRLAKCQVQILIEEAYEFHTFDFKNAHRIYRAGYEQAIRQIPEIQKKLSPWWKI